MNKGFLIRFYDKTNAFTGTLKNKKVTNKVGFNSKINKGQGELVIRTNYTDGDLPSFVTNESYVEVTIYPDGTPEGIRVYYGIVGKITTTLRSGTETIDIRVLGLGTFLSRGYLKDGASYARNHTGSVEDGVKAVIDHFKTVYPDSPIHYTAGSIGTTGQNVDIDFSEQTWQQCLDSLVEATGESWYYFIDQDGLLTFKQKYTGTEHEFTKGFNLHALTIPNSSEKIINKATIRWGNNQTTSASSAASIAEFGEREKVIFNSDIKDLATAEALANSKLAEFGDEKRIPQIKINSTYQFENIKIGDTCVIQNYENDLADMFIHSITYDMEVATLFIDEKVELADILYKNAEQQAKQAADGVEVKQAGEIAVTSVLGRTGAVVAATNDYTWAQINKSTSDIADITNRSHLDLQDIGDYAHTEIDDHIDDLGLHFELGDIDHNTITNGHNLTSDINHNLLGNYVANQHLDWTNAVSNFKTIGTISGDFSEGSILWSGASGLISQDNSCLFWDNTNKYLGLCTNSPSYPFHLSRDIPGYADFAVIEDLTDPGNGATGFLVKNSVSAIRLRAWGSAAAGILGGNSGFVSSGNSAILGANTGNNVYILSNSNITTPDIQCVGGLVGIKKTPTAGYALDVHGVFRTDNAAFVGGGLNVDGAATLYNTLDVSGIATFLAAVQVGANNGTGGYASRIYYGYSTTPPTGLPIGSIYIRLATP